MGVWYCTRESVKAALDIKETARSNRQVDDAIEAGARNIEGLTHRKFRPELATRYFDWPNYQYASPWRLWLDGNELISATTVTSGGVTIASSDYFLEPNYGPPFDRIEIDLDSNASFESGDTHQRNIGILGLYGYQNDEESVGALSSQLDADVNDTATVTWTTARIGVGDVLRIDNERMIVAERTFVDSTQNVQTSMTASMSDDLVDVTTGTAFAVEEVLQIGTEQMLVVSITGNNLTVKRAWNGTTLAAHNANDDVYTLTGIDLDRAQLGTTLALHLNGATVYRHKVPSLIESLNRAEAISIIQQEQSGWARTAGSGDNEREVGGKGLLDLRKQVRTRYGRKARTLAV